MTLPNAMNYSHLCPDSTRQEFREMVRAPVFPGKVNRWLFMVSGALASREEASRAVLDIVKPSTLSFADGALPRGTVDDARVVYVGPAPPAGSTTPRVLVSRHSAVREWFQRGAHAVSPTVAPSPNAPSYVAVEFGYQGLPTDLPWPAMPSGCPTSSVAFLEAVYEPGPKVAPKKDLPSRIEDTGASIERTVKIIAVVAAIGLGVAVYKGVREVTS